MEDNDSKTLVELRQLGANLDRLRSTEGWKSWLALVDRLHAYSPNNCILIWSRRPDATMVMGYKAWQKIGRQVRRGEKGIGIIVPMMVKDRSPEAEEGGKVMRFGVGHVFDVSQTDGAPLVDPFAEVFSGVRVPDPEMLDRLMTRVSERTDIALATARGNVNGARGWYSHEERTITIVDNDDTTAASKVRTLLHELGHAHDPQIDDAAEMYQSRRAEFEMIAEASAWLVSRRLGVEMDDASAAYLASWGCTDEQLIDACKRVMAAAAGTRAVVVDEEGMETDERGAA